ncbi:MAG: hypothetical protein L0332_36080 [Chloroflexi bacterium]|nr:hypothetical protein [Chloroflexota bacterium]MCI0578301.1 hypothetical protein [Chloroflexota bacterium]MCI0648750.1 hypothetical protein [Chloroflexota bacterium]MCI0732117.1 hypothetical protein [Chloroflexota bacterium]
MKEYNRTTRDCSFGDLRPELQAAIRQYAGENLLGDVAAEVLACCETRSERRPKGTLGRLKDRLLGPYDPDPVHFTAVVVTPHWLIWAHSGEKRGAHTLAARLEDITVQDYAFSHLVPDDGLTVQGQIRGFGEAGQAFIGLAPGPAADHFKRVVQQAIEKANTST